MITIKFLRRILLILVSRVIHRNRIADFSNVMSFSSRIYDSTIGSYNYFGPGVVINRTIFKNYCSIAANVIIGNMEHDYSQLSTSTKLFPHNKFKTTFIEDDVWIGANSVIRTGITIGKGSVVGANTTVLKDVPPMSIVVGSPGRIIKNRFIDKIKAEEYLKLDFSCDPDSFHKNLK